MSAQPHDDEFLLRRYRDSGDSTAFSALVDRHLPLVYNTAHRDLFHEHDAKDVCQEVFATLAIKARSLRIRHLGSWLYKCTQNQVRIMKRSEGRRRAREAKAAELAAVEEAVYQSGEPDAGPRIRELFVDLPERDQQALFLRFHDELDFREIGEAMGTNQRAAQKRVYRAIEKLRQNLSKRGITTTAALIAGGLTAANAVPQPPALESAVTKSALFKAAAAPVPSLLSAWLASPATWVFGAAILAVSGVTVLAIDATLRSNVDRETITTEPAGLALPEAVARARPQSQQRSGPTIAVDDIEAIYALPVAEREPYLVRLVRHLERQSDADYFQDLFQRWSALDHERCALAVVDLFDRFENDPARDALLAEGLSIPVKRWSGISQSTLREWVQNLPRTRNGEPVALETALKAIAARDVPSAFVLLAARGATDDAPYEVLASVIAASGLEQAWETLAALPDPDKTGAASTRDPSVQIEDDALAPKVRLVAATVARLAEDSPQQVADWVATLPDTEQANAVTAAFAVTWAKRDPVEAARWTEELGQGARNVIIPALASQWASVDPSAAVHWSANPDLTDEPFGSAREAFRAWSHKSSDDARAWLEPHLDDPEAVPLFGDLSDALEPPAAISWANRLGPSASRRLALQHAFYAMAHADPAAAKRALAGIQPAATREEAAFAVAQGLFISRGRAAAAQWAEAEAEAGREIEANAARVAEVNILAALNPDLAVKVVFDMASGTRRDALLSELIGRTHLRSGSHAKRAEEWTQHFASPGLRDHWLVEIHAAQARQPWENQAQLPRVRPQSLKAQTYGEFRACLDILASLPPLRR